MATGSSTLVEVDSDGGLVLGTLAGDRASFAALYDRFGAGVYDLHLALLDDPDRAAEATRQTFRRAVAGLNHLGDPSELRPWLYGVAYRQRTTEEHGGDGDDDTRDEDEEDDVPRAALARAVGELGRLDRALLTLHLRHGLDATEVGRIVGLPARRAAGRLRTLGTRLAPKLEPLLRARLAADHPEPLRAAVPLAVPPRSLRTRVLRETALMSAHEGLPRPRTRAAWTWTVACVLVVVTGTALFVQRNMERKPMVAVTFGPSFELTLSTTVIDLGAAESTATVTLSNTGATPSAWRAVPADPWLKVTPASGVLAGNTTQELTVVADRGAVPHEGDARTRLGVGTADGQGQVDVTVALRQERPPVITNAGASATRIGGYGCPTVSVITATVRDESPPVRVVLVGPGQRSQPMQANGDTYTGRLGSGSGANIVWQVTATDSRGNTATGPPRVITYGDCAARPTPTQSPSQPPSSAPPSSEETPNPDDERPPAGQRTPTNDDNGGGRDDDPPNQGDDGPS
ncbi:BACON domain-containing protein [Pseudonocardia acaciae]|uniref:BACON domain-containing protein n=1 Tax=Pseudonocardia acaciae TaxID=551276 RepID=UPI0012ED4542|nr:hypothetical protein [Pseudonocardia acaciae]